MPATYTFGPQAGNEVSALDDTNHILVQIAVNTGGPLYEDGTEINPLDDVGRILAQIALNTE